MKHRTRIIALFLAFAGLLGVVGCAGEKGDIESVFKRYMSGVNAYDASIFEQELYFESADEQDIYFWGLNNEEFKIYQELSDYTDKFTVFLQAAAKEATFSVKETTIDGNSAKIKASVRYVDGSQLVCTVFERMYSSVIGSKLDGLEYHVDELLYEAIYNLTYNTEFNFTTIDITLDLKKTDAGWKILPSDELKQISTSDFYKNIEEINAEINKYTTQTEDKTK